MRGCDHISWINSAQLSCLTKFTGVDQNPYAAPGFGKSIVLIDLGLRYPFTSIDLGCNVTVTFYSVKLKELKTGKPDGIILSSGPGNSSYRWYLPGYC